MLSKCLTDLGQTIVSAASDQLTIPINKLPLLYFPGLKAMSSEQYIVTVFSFKRNYRRTAMPKLSKTTDMDASFSSSLSNNQYGPPLDYSFRNISSLEKLERNRPPRQSLRKQVGKLLEPVFYTKWQRKSSKTS